MLLVAPRFALAAKRCLAWRVSRELYGYASWLRKRLALSGTITHALQHGNQCFQYFPVIAGRGFTWRSGQLYARVVRTRWISR